MSIIFYSMGARCGYCKKAEALLKPQIQNGDIVKKSASEAGGKFTGFPAFTSTKTQKTSMGCPKSYEDLAQKLGHTEGYSSGMRGGHHNPYLYNAMPTIAQSSACPTDSAGNLILPSNCDVKDPKCVSCCQKYHQDNCPETDPGENQCHYLCSSPSPGPGPGSSPAYDGQCKNKPPSDLSSCCANACNNNTQTACYMECEKSGPLPTNCNPPPKGMSGTECCEKGGQAGGVGQCPPGCNDEAGECVPASGGGGGGLITKRGCYSCDSKGGVYHETGSRCDQPNFYFNGTSCNPNAPQSCASRFPPGCSGGGGGGNGGGKGGSSSKGGDKKKSMSHLEIALIVIAVLGLLGLVGFLAYRAKK